MPGKLQKNGDKAIFVSGKAQRSVTDPCTCDCFTPQGCLRARACADDSLTNLYGFLGHPVNVWHPDDTTAFPQEYPLGEYITALPFHFDLMGECFYFQESDLIPCSSIPTIHRTIDMQLWPYSMREDFCPLPLELYPPRCHGSVSWLDDTCEYPPALAETPARHVCDLDGDGLIDPPHDPPGTVAGDPCGCIAAGGTPTDILLEFVDIGCDCSNNQAWNVQKNIGTKSMVLRYDYADLTGCVWRGTVPVVADFCVDSGLGCVDDSGDPDTPACGGVGESFELKATAWLRWFEPPDPYVTRGWKVSVSCYGRTSGLYFDNSTTAYTQGDCTGAIGLPNDLTECRGGDPFAAVYFGAGGSVNVRAIGGTPLMGLRHTSAAARAEPIDWTTRGPELWRELHQRPREWPGGDDTTWLREFAKRVPCGTCRRHFLNMLRQIPPDFADTGSYFASTVAWHNDVNAKLNKPEIPLLEARALWGY